MMLSKVLVTGITGLLGRALRTELPTGDIEVVGTGLTRAQGDVRRLDLLDTASVEELFAAEKPDVVIHAAAERRPDVSQADPDGTRPSEGRSQSSQIVRVMSYFVIASSPDQ